MYRAILVDDEYWTLLGIQHTFDWPAYNMEIAGSYMNAAEALIAIEELKPDVVFTDICMPGISGLELLQELRRLELDIEVVIISGYSEFEYTRKAIQNGAFDYCLKPIDEELAVPLLDRLQKRLDSKRQKKMMDLLDIIGNERGGENRNASSLGLPTIGRLYQMVAYTGKAEAYLFEKLKGIRETHCVMLQTRRRRYMIVNGDADISERILPYSGPGVIGLSTSIEGVQDISLLAEQAAIAAATASISQIEGAFKYGGKETRKLKSFLIRAIHLLDNGQFVQFQALVNTIPGLLKEEAFSVEDLCYIWNQLHIQGELVTSAGNQSLGFVPLEWQQLDNKFDDIHDFCHSLFHEIMGCYSKEPISSELDDSDQSGFNKMIAYLHSNYNQQVKLKDLAQQFYINKNYASYLFQKYTGTTYSEYINKLRMEKARELLLKSSLTIAEVAEQSGYIDYFYFSKLFKKSFGVSPTAYRKDPTAFVYPTSAD